MAAGYKQAWSSWTLGPEARQRPGPDSRHADPEDSGVANRAVGYPRDPAGGWQSNAETYVIAVLANLDPPAATRISEFIVNRLAIGVRR